MHTPAPRPPPPPPLSFHTPPSPILLSSLSPRVTRAEFFFCHFLAPPPRGSYERRNSCVPGRNRHRNPGLGNGSEMTGGNRRFLDHVARRPTCVGENVDDDDDEDDDDETARAMQAYVILLEARRRGEGRTGTTLTGIRVSRPSGLRCRRCSPSLKRKVESRGNAIWKFREGSRSAPSAPSARRAIGCAHLNFTARTEGRPVSSVWFVRPAGLVSSEPVYISFRDEIRAHCRASVTSRFEFSGRRLEYARRIRDEHEDPGSRGATRKLSS